MLPQGGSLVHQVRRWLKMQIIIVMFIFICCMSYVSIYSIYSISLSLSVYLSPQSNVITSSIFVSYLTTLCLHWTQVLVSAGSLYSVFSPHMKTRDVFLQSGITQDLFCHMLLFHWICINSLMSPTGISHALSSISVLEQHILSKVNLYFVLEYLPGVAGTFFFL